MRLWHKDLIGVLPRQQMLGQWRECCAIASNIHSKGSPNHILVNKIMEYPLKHFYSYGLAVGIELEYRGYSIDFDRFTKFFSDEDKHLVPGYRLFLDWHNDRYLAQCLCNLQEKRDCGGISDEEWLEIEKSFGGHRTIWI